MFVRKLYSERVAGRCILCIIAALDHGALRANTEAREVGGLS